MSSNQSTLEKLLTLRKELTDRIDAIDKDIHHKKEPVEKDFAEQVTQRENDEVLSAIDGESKLTVQLINDAISRIKSGCYYKFPNILVRCLVNLCSCITGENDCLVAISHFISFQIWA